jgi:GNAT superfamily N-acetyltransferase
MSLLIRQADERDAGSLARLLGCLAGQPMDTAEALERLAFVAESESDFLFVCEEDDRVVAVLGFRFRENVEQAGRYGEISALVVDPDYRRRGVGRFMMSFAEVMAEHEGCIGTWLVSGLGREEDAHVFYRGLGYQVTGYRFVKPREE